MGKIIRISIDLTKIDKSKIKDHSNGSKYLDLVVDEKQQPDQYGNTHAVYINQSKEERDARVKKCYLGNGKEFVFGQPQQQQQHFTPTPPTTNVKQSATPPDANDDLPF